MLLCVTSTATHTLELSFLIILQENVDTVTTARVEIVGEEDCIKTKTEEEFCIELVRTIKCEEEVSVVCWCFFVVVIYLNVRVYVCFVRCLDVHAYVMVLFSACKSARCKHVICCV
jgi:hypothetical protein